VPVYNDQAALAQCLTALTASASAENEIIVVDDASTDASGAVAARMPVRLVRLPANAGPAAARNCGARLARGAVLLFVDSDVVVAPDAVERVTRLFRARPDVAAVFGSYDAEPADPGVVSRYKNLLHHFVHQNGEAQASTFWAGCGAIRKRAFDDVGRFDETRFRRPSIEDIELGQRLRRAGHRILLDRALLGKHLKRWTLGSLLRADVIGRAIPWSRLIAESGEPARDLNVSWDQRVSAGLVGLAALCLVLAPAWPGLAVVTAAALLAVILLNRRLYGLFVQKGGLAFAAACLFLHWLYYVYSMLVYVGTWAAVRLGRIPGALPMLGRRADRERGPRTGSDRTAR
jgi:GT2 family glycosyltransferase